MEKYRMKPVVIEACQWDGTDASTKKITGLSPKITVFEADAEQKLVVMTASGRAVANVGDWIIRCSDESILPMGDRMFRATYEPDVEPATQGGVGPKDSIPAPAATLTGTAGGGGLPYSGEAAASPGLSGPSPE